MSVLQRMRERVIGGSPSPWDLAMARGVSIAAFLMAFIFARGGQLDDLPVVGFREELLIAIFAVGSALLVSGPLALLLRRLVGSADPPAVRRRHWLIAGATVLLISGVVSPLALRMAWAGKPPWTATLEPLAWFITDIPVAAVTGVPPGGAGGAASWAQGMNIAGRASAWTAMLGAWLACWPLVRRISRVHVGWPVSVSFGALALGAMLARSFIAARQDSLPAALLAALAASAIPCILAWRFVASAGARWPMPESAAAPRHPARLDAFGAARVATCAVGATFAWLAFLAVMSPPALASLARSFRAPPLVGDMAPAFSLPDRNGATIRLADLRGRPTLVSFGASWCGPCQREFPHLAELAESGGAMGFPVFWISNDEDRSALESFLADQPKSPRVLLANAEALLSYDIDGIPATFLIDSEGRIAWRQVGFGPEGREQLDAAIAALRPPGE